jgi:MFS family permease
LGKLGIVIFSPFTGRFHDKHEPFTYAAMLFGLLALYPILLAVSSSLGLSVVYLAFLFFSFAMAGVLITWNIGSIYFAEPNREVAYQSVHLTMTGVRGIIAPVIGWMIMSFADFNTAFVVSAVIFIIAAYLMSRSGKKFKNITPCVR